MSHHYTSSLNYERLWQPIADNFYLSKYPSSEIIRYDNDSETDLSFQRKDIDLSLKIEERMIHISEKFRKDDFGDLLIELYSKYPHKKGWMENSEADFIAYFCPKTVYFIDKKELLTWFQSEMILENLENELRIFHNSNLQKSSRIRTIMTLNNKSNINLDLIQAYNQTSDAEWHTISIGIKWNDLKNLGLKVKSFNLD